MFPLLPLALVRVMFYRKTFSLQSCWHTKTGNESQLDAYIEAAPLGRRLAHVAMAAHASLALSKPHSQGTRSLVFLMELFRTSSAKSTCVVTPDPCMLQLVSFLLLWQGQAQILVVLLPAIVLCAMLWQHLIFLDLSSKISNLACSALATGGSYQSFIRSEMGHGDRVCVWFWWDL